MRIFKKIQMSGMAAYYFLTPPRLYVTVFLIVFSGIGVWYAITEPVGLGTLIPTIVYFVMSRFDETWKYTREEFQKIKSDEQERANRAS